MKPTFTRGWEIQEFTGTEELDEGLCNLSAGGYLIINVLLDVSAGYQNFVVIAYQDYEDIKL